MESDLRGREGEREGVTERRLGRRPLDGLRETRRLTGDLVGLRRRRREGGVGDRRLLLLDGDRDSRRLARAGVRDLRRGGVRDLHEHAAT